MTYQGLKRDKTKSGVPRIRHRATGLTLHGAEGSEQFDREYQAAEAIARGEAAPARKLRLGPQPERRAREGSLDELLANYYKSPGWRKLSDETQDSRESTMTKFCDRTVDGRRIGSVALRHFRKRHFIVARDALQDTPEAANYLIKGLRQAFEYAVDLELIEDNPTAFVKKLPPNNADGHYQWQVEDVHDYFDCHKIGTQAHLTVTLALLCGARRSDLHEIGPGHELDAIEDGKRVRVLFFKPRKTDKGDDPVSCTVPMLPDLTAAIRACRNDGPTYIVGEWGTPFTHAGSLSNRVRQWCDEAAEKSGNKNLLRASLHGLRKAAAAFAAERGASTTQLMALFGWLTSKEADRYIKKFQRARASTGAAHLLGLPERQLNRVSHPMRPTLSHPAKKPTKSRA
jgi:integrase